MPPPSYAYFRISVGILASSTPTTGHLRHVMLELPQIDPRASDNAVFTIRSTFSRIVTLSHLVFVEAFHDAPHAVKV